MDEVPELELIAHGKLGDQAAIAELFRRHYPRSLRLATGILRSPEESQDVVQTAYLSAFLHLQSFRGDSCFRKWIARIVLNCCFVRVRSPWRHVTWVNLERRDGKEKHDGYRGLDSLASPAPTPEHSAWCQEIASAHSHGLARLPKRQREIYNLCAVSGLPVEQAAKALGISLSAAKTRLFRARAAMRLHLEPVWLGAKPSIARR
jgi:RNA polymerase sigma-70 factor (ECF subfamily)